MDNETERRGYMPPSADTEWATPPELFDALDAEFGPFTCDPACLPPHYTAWRVLRRDGRICIPPGITAPYLGDGPGTINVDGLTSSWSGRVFLNPPYGRGVEKWIAKAVAEVEAGNVELVCALVKATTGGKWWQKYVVGEVLHHNQTYGAATIDGHRALRVVRFLPGRLHFGGDPRPAPFPSAVVVWQR